ncbi:hypothetical protein M5K25_008079 [Dendrobium thyrsiflorum]|uniref:Uncharacterized protein n=1 Tax=Dendrobium thyrsiflorum TaxID=117978 RepID=A0ABD0V7X1_DENTH
MFFWVLRRKVESTSHEVLRRHVAIGAGDTGLDMGEFLWEEPGHAEVCDFGAPTLVEKDVAGLYIPMNDGCARVFVQVQKTSGYSDDHLETPSPMENLRRHLPTLPCFISAFLHESPM